jgi:hypothetical protein
LVKEEEVVEAQKNRDLKIHETIEDNPHYYCLHWTVSEPLQLVTATC